jgi:hypothetical protein
LRDIGVKPEEKDKVSKDIKVNLEEDKLLKDNDIKLEEDNLMEDIKIKDDNNLPSQVVEYEVKNKKDETNETSEKEVEPRKIDKDKIESKTEVYQVSSTDKMPGGIKKVKKDKQLRLSHEMFWINKLEREEAEKEMNISKIRKKYLVYILLTILHGDCFKKLDDFRPICVAA